MVHKAGLWVRSGFQAGLVPLTEPAGPDEFDTPALQSFVSSVKRFGFVVLQI